MTQTELILALTKDFGFPKHYAKRVFKSLITTIKTEVSQGNPVKIRGFGTFEIRHTRGKNRVKFTTSKNFTPKPDRKPAK